MRLHWFSSLTPGTSPAAVFSDSLLPALSRVANITIWVPESQANSRPLQNLSLCTYRLDQLDWFTLNSADLCVLHLTNSPEDRDTWELSRYLHGLVVLHEASFHDLLVEPYRKNQDAFGYQCRLGQWYGLAGAQAARRFWSSQISPEEMRSQFPLACLAAQQALGVISPYTCVVTEVARNRPELPCQLLAQAGSKETSAQHFLEFASRVCQERRRLAEEALTRDVAILSNRWFSDPLSKGPSRTSGEAELTALGGFCYIYSS